MTLYTNPNGPIGARITGEYLLACIESGIVVPANIDGDGELSGIDAIHADDAFAVCMNSDSGYVEFWRISGGRLYILTLQDPHYASLPRLKQTT